MILRFNFVERVANPLTLYSAGCHIALAGCPALHSEIVQGERTLVEIEPFKKVGTGLRMTCPTSEEMISLAKVGGKALIVSEQPSQGFYTNINLRQPARWP
jgi:hypothetical protein